MASLLQKAARVNLVAMDFVLQVTVVKLVLGALEHGRVLSFELSRGTKSSGLPPKLVSTRESEWGQTMQVVLTLFLDKRSGRFQGKEYKLRLVQLGKDEAIITAFELATFPLDASLYAHLGAGPSVEQPVDLYAPTPSETGGFANVHLRVRCCETGGEAASALSVSTPNMADVRRAPPFGTGLPPRGPTSYRRPSLPPLQSGLLGSSFGFSMSGSETRNSAVSTSSSAFSTPTMPGRGRPWTNDDIELTGSSMSARRRRGARRLRSKFGSKSFNDLDDSGRASRSVRSGSPISFHTSVGSVASTTDIASSQYSPGITFGSRITSGRDSMASSRSGSLFATPGSVAHERTNTVGYNRLLARFAKGPSPRVGRLRGEFASAGVEALTGVEDSEKGDNGVEAGSEELARTNENAGGGGGGEDGNDAPVNNTSGIALGIVGMRRLSTSSKPAPAAMAPLELPLMGGSVSATATSAATATAEPSAEAPSKKQYLTQGGIGDTREQSAEAPSKKQYLTQGGIGETREQTAVSSQKQQQQQTRQMEMEMQQLQVQQQQQQVQHQKQREQQAQTQQAQQMEMEQLQMQQLQMQQLQAQQQQHQKEMEQQTQKIQRHRQHGGGRSLSGRTPSLAKTSASGAGRGWVSSRTSRGGPPGGGNEIGGDGGGASMSTAAAVAPDATGRHQSERRQSEDSTGGGSAVAAPLSSATAGGEGVGGRGKRTDGEELVEMENRVLHLEAALMRSELDLYRARNELAVVRKEATELRASKNRVDEDPSKEDRPREDRPSEVSSSVDTSALYHALEGSVALLQIASEKMLQLEETISKYRSIIPKRVFNELQECVIQDATAISPMRQDMRQVRPREEKMEEQRRREQLRQRVQQESA